MTPTKAPQRAPTALTIAGSDSGGGAGVQADLKTFSALGVFGCSAITALTAQNTRAVTAVAEAGAEMVSAQIRTVLDDIAVDAVKIGMLFSTNTIVAVADALAGFTAPVILDPVMIAKSGDALLQDAAIDALRDRMVPRADLLTPNLPEAARLLAEPPAEDEAAMARQGQALIGLGAKAVLMKGGHGGGATCVDLLVRPEAPPLRLTAPRLKTKNTHGTGCTLSAAIAAEMAKGADMGAAATAAHAYLQAAMARAYDLGVGHGAGPVHHFHAVWN
jgi:hydroxymethylpyrimidine/phosphomethylpyrimidine kinase